MAFSPRPTVVTPPGLGPPEPLASRGPSEWPGGWQGWQALRWGLAGTGGGPYSHREPWGAHRPSFLQAQFPFLLPPLPAAQSQAEAQGGEGPAGTRAPPCTSQGAAGLGLSERENPARTVPTGPEFVPEESAGFLPTSERLSRSPAWLPTSRLGKGRGGSIRCPRPTPGSVAPGFPAPGAGTGLSQEALEARASGSQPGCFPRTCLEAGARAGGWRVGVSSARQEGQGSGACGWVAGAGCAPLLSSCLLRHWAAVVGEAGAEQSDLAGTCPEQARGGRELPDPGSVRASEEWRAAGVGERSTEPWPQPPPGHAGQSGQPAHLAAPKALCSSGPIPSPWAFRASGPSEKLPAGPGCSGQT